jgi:YidC/Oxa1 family membrane protein insertase
MPAFLGVPVDAAYHVVSALASFLAPLPGGLAAAAAIVGFTMAVRLLLAPLSYRAMRGLDAQARMASQVQALREQHAGQPDRLQRELAALYQAEGTSMFAGCLPTLAQWPVLSVLYLLFRSPRVGGAPNTLLTHGLFGAPLDSHWLGGAGPFSAHGAVFAGLFVLLAGIGWLSARLARRTTARAGTARAGTGHPGFAAPAALARVLPFATVAVAAFVPLAAGLYLLTTTAWTLAERALARRALAARPTGRAPS